MEKKREKNIIKIIGLVSAVLLIVGGLMFTIGMTALGWDFSSLDTEELTAQKYTAETSINAIEIDGEWNYRITSGEETSISYYSSNKSTITVRESTYTLYFEEDGYGSTFGFSFNRANVFVDIVLEEGVDISIDTVSSDVTITNHTASKVEIDSTSADIVMSGCNIESMEVDGVSCDIRLSQSTIATLDIDSASSDLELTSCTIDNFAFNSTSGDVDAVSSFIKHSKINGASAEVAYENCDIYAIIADGVSIELDLELVGAKSDFASIATTGISSETEIDDVKGNYYYSGGGYKSISVDGVSAKLEVEFIGGKSIY